MFEVVPVYGTVWRQPLSRRIFLLDIGYIVGRLDPFFAKTATGEKISRYLIVADMVISMPRQLTALSICYA
jgi:hypothetical protein